MNNNKKSKYPFIKNNKVLISCVFIALFVVFSIMFWFLYESLEITNSGIVDTKVFSLEEVNRTHLKKEDYDKAPLYIKKGSGENTTLVPTTAYLTKSDYNDEVFYEKVETPLGADFVKNENYIRKIDFNNFEVIFWEETEKITDFTSYKNRFVKKEDLNDSALYQNVQKEGDFNRWEGKDQEYFTKDSLKANLYLREGSGNDVTFKDMDKTLYLKTLVDANTRRRYITPSPNDNDTSNRLLTYTYKFGNFTVDGSLTPTRFAIYDNPGDSGADNQAKGTFTLKRGETKTYYIVATSVAIQTVNNTVDDVAFLSDEYWVGYLLNFKMIVKRESDDRMTTRLDYSNTNGYGMGSYYIESKNSDISVLPDQYGYPWNSSLFKYQSRVKAVTLSAPSTLGWFQTYIEEFTKV